MLNLLEPLFTLFSSLTVDATYVGDDKLGHLQVPLRHDEIPMGGTHNILTMYLEAVRRTFSSQR